MIELSQLNKLPFIQVYRDGLVENLYAKGHDRPNSIAYALTPSSLKNICTNRCISAIITKNTLCDYVPDNIGIIISENPKETFFLLNNYLVESEYIKPLNPSFIHELATIHPSAIIGPNVWISEGVKIGAYSVIHSNTKILPNVEVAEFVTLGANGMQDCLIDGKNFSLLYSGGVFIGENSKILTGAIIQKPYQNFYTTVGSNCILSTQTILGHGATLGDRVMVSGKAGIAGNTVIGNDVWVGAGASISNDLTIGNNVSIKIRSVVISNIYDGENVSGNFAIDHKSNLKDYLRRRST